MPRRRKSRHDLKPELLPPADSRTGWNWITLAALLVGAQGMVVLFGGTRFWASGPFLALFLLGMGISSLAVARDAGREPGRLQIPVELWGGLAVIGYVVLRALWAPQIPYETWTEAYLLLCGWLCWMTWNRLGASRHAWTVVGTVLLTAAMLHSMNALRMHVLGERNVLWLMRPPHYAMRASGTFICPNHFGHLLQMAAVVGASFVLTPRMRLSLRIFAGYCLVLILPALFLTLSRSAVLGALAGTGVVALVPVLRAGKKRVVLVGVAGGLLVLLAAGAAVWLYPPFRERVVRGVDNNIRLTMIWPDTLSMIRSEGLLGSGPGTFPHVFDQYREHFNLPHLYLEYAHNEYLHTAAEYGVPVALLILFGIGWMLVRWIRAAGTADSHRKAMIPATLLGLWTGTLVHAVFDFNLHITANALVLVMLWGTLHGAGAVRGLWGFRGFLSPRTTRALLAVTGLVSLALLVPTVPLSIGSWHAYRMRLAVEEKDPAAAARESAAVRSWLPGRSDGWTQLGLEKRQQAFWMRDPERRAALIEESRAAYEAALERNSHDLIALAGLVELLRMEGEGEEALAAVRRLRRLTPYDVQVRILEGQILRGLERNPEALEVFLEAKRMRKTPDRQIELNIRALKRKL